MELLPDSDIRLMLGFLHEASEVDGPEAFTEPVVQALWRLIPADAGAVGLSFTGAAPDVAPEDRTVLSFSNVESGFCVNVQSLWTDELDEICRQYVERQEAIPPTPKFINRALRTSDVITRREQQRLELWQLVSRRTGCEDALRLWLAVPGEEGLRRIDFITGRRGGLSDRDVRVLELLTPHLARLYGRAAARREALPGPSGLTPREQEIVGLIAHGKTNHEIARVLWISPNTVRKHLENIFAKLGVTNRMAAAVQAFGPPPHGQEAHNGAPH
jgi:DNA-binding CsgD family transcriptional regulator